MSSSTEHAQQNAGQLAEPAVLVLSHHFVFHVQACFSPLFRHKLQGLRYLAEGTVLA